MPPPRHSCCPEMFASEEREILSTLARSLPHQPLRHFVVSYILTLLPLTGSLTACVLFPSWPTYAIVALIAGFTQNALGILMHEGSHYFFHINKRANDLLADFLVCLPIFNTVSGYRSPHFEHHRHFGRQEDPYHDLYANYRSQFQVARSFLADLLLVSAIARFTQRYGGRQKEKQPGYAMPGLFAVQGILWLAMYLVTGSFLAYFLMWLLPLMTIPLAVNRLRTIAEHLSPDVAPVSRCTIVGWIEYCLIAPYGYAHHREHHLLSSIPYYHLASAHRHLRERGDSSMFDHHAPTGYLGTFFWLLQRIGEKRKWQLKPRQERSALMR
jgi:fatty acid desaturase